MNYLTVGQIACLLNLSISATQRKMQKIIQAGIVPIEDFNEWVERHIKNKAKYQYLIKAIERIDAKEVMK